MFNDLWVSLFLSKNYLINLMLLFVIIEHTKKYDIFLSHMQARIIVFERRGQTHPKNLNKQKTKEQKDNFSKS